MNTIIKIILLLLILVLVFLFFNMEFISNYYYYKKIGNSNKNMKTIPNDILNLPNNYYGKDLSKEKLVVVISHYNENLSWLKNTNAPFVISSKTNKDKNLYVDINKGNEVSGYLTYITKNYDNLPEYTLFLHGHFVDLHQFENTIDIINNLYKIINNKKINYLNVNNLGVPDFLWTEHRRKIWNELFFEELGTMPEVLYDKCCAQFIVNKDSIRLRPNKFYQKLLYYSLHNNIDTKNNNFGHVMEFLWHYIFGEPAIINREEDNHALFNLKYFRNNYT
jgi:hypothetical protein